MDFDTVGGFCIICAQTGQTILGDDRENRILRISFDFPDSADPVIGLSGYA